MSRTQDPQPARLDIPVAPNAVVSTIHNVYSPRLFQIMSDTYMAGLFAEDLCFFISLPFEDVRNRPGSSLLAIFCLLFTFVICLLLLPVGLSILPNQQSYFSHVVSSILQVLTFILSIVGTVNMFKQKEPLYISVSDEVVDFTRMCRAAAVVTMVTVSITLVLCLTNTVLYGRALYRLANRRSKELAFTTELDDLSATFRDGQTIVNQVNPLPNESDQVFPNEIINTINERFV